MTLFGLKFARAAGVNYGREVTWLEFKLIQARRGARQIPAPVQSALCTALVAAVCVRYEWKTMRTMNMPAQTSVVTARNSLKELKLSPFRRDLPGRLLLDSKAAEFK